MPVSKVLFLGPIQGRSGFTNVLLIVQISKAKFSEQPVAR